MSDNNTAITTQRAHHVSMSVNHPKLLRSDPEMIRRFLNLYDQYVNEVKARSRQLGDENFSTESTKPVDLKFCIDIDLLQSTIALGIIEGATSYNDITDDKLRAHLDSEASESRTNITLTVLDSIFKRELRMDMKNTGARSRIKNLFIDYHTLLRQHGLTWLLEDNQKVALQNVLSAIRPQKLKDRLVSDISFSHHNVKKAFGGFFDHAKKVTDAFLLIDGGLTEESRTSDRKPTHNSGGNRDGAVKGTSGTTQTQEEPICLWEPHKSRGIRHKLKDCRSCPQEEKKKLFEKLSKDRAKDGPAKTPGAKP